MTDIVCNDKHEKEYYLPEMFRLIDKLEVPQLIGEFENEYIS